MRLKRIKMWCNYRPDGDIAGNTINLIIVDRRQCRPIEWSDTATFATPAFLSKKFSKYDPIGLWYLTESGETNPEVRFYLPKGGLLEITFDYILSDGSCTSFSSSTLSYPYVYSQRMHADLSVVGRSEALTMTM